VAGDQDISVTVSMGAALIEPGDGLEMASDLADAALYMAKDQGRNRVVLLGPEEEAASRHASG
jgi:PleD family two-component response regulator